MKTFSAKDVEVMLNKIPVPEEYIKWLSVCSAVWDILPAGEGSMLLNQWDPERPGFSYMGKYKHRLGKVTAGTLVHLAKLGGWKGSGMSRGVGKVVLACAPKRTTRNTRPSWLSGAPSPPRPVATYIAKPDPIEAAREAASYRAQPPSEGCCSMCWNRWGRFLREGSCICTGDVAL